MQSAVSDITTHLFPAMRDTQWWDEGQQSRCLWSAAAAAEYLRRRRVRAKAVVGAFVITLMNAAGDSQWGEGSLGVGLPDTSTGHPGLHSLVEIADRSGPWLLDVNIWQGHRPRFSGLPDAVAVSHDFDQPLLSCPEFRIVGVLSRDSDRHRVNLLVARDRQETWAGNDDDTEPRRARVAADRIEARVRAAVQAQSGG